MKKIQLLLLSAIFSISILNVYAGDDDSDTKGIRAGWQQSNFYDNGNSDDDNLSSFYVGVFGEKKLIPLLRLGAGLEYNSVGINSKNIDDTRFTRHSLAVPIYAKVKLGPVFALGGAAPNFGLSNKFKLAGEDVSLDDDMKTSTFDVPLYLGLGAKFLMISVEARYHWGTMNLSKEDNTNFTQQYFQIGAAVSF